MARGFALLSPERRREVSAKGGSASGANFKNDPARASAMGKVGGVKSRGRFKPGDPEAAAAGRKGGYAKAKLKRKLKVAAK